jgi:hypothetical protein
MIIYIVIQNRLYPKFELNLIFKLIIEIVVISIIEDILKFALPIKQEILMQKFKNLLNNEENPIINKTI